VSLGGIGTVQSQRVRVDVGHPPARLPDPVFSVPPLGLPAIQQLLAPAGSLGTLNTQGPGTRSKSAASLCKGSSFTE
jgi:hypothetical protein